MKTSKKEKVFLLLAAIILGGSLGFALLIYRTGWLAGDEAVFIRITEHLPEYKSYAEWWTRDGVTRPEEIDYLPESTFYHNVLDTPIWRHPPLANYLAWPTVKLLMSEENVEAIDTGTVKLRTVAWSMLAFCTLSAVYIVRRKDKSGDVMLLTVLPLAGGYALFAQSGANWFYHDAFMLVFLATALLMRKTKYEKYIYIPLAMMVCCKITAILFLIPFVIEKRKTILCGLALVPYLVQVWIVTGSPFWIVQHWNMINNTADSTPTKASPEMVAYLLNILNDTNYLIPLLVVTAVPFAYITYRAVRKRGDWFYPVLFAIACVPTVGWAMRYWDMLGLYYYQMLPMVIVGMLVAGEAAVQFKNQREVIKNETKN